MMALSIKHPWMQWTLEGVKRAERRPWNTHYRGPVLLCSSKELDTAAATEDAVTRGWRYGMALAVAELVEVRPMRDDDAALTCCANQLGAFVFIWGAVRPVRPFPVRGLPGLFDVEDALIDFVPAGTLSAGGEKTSGANPRRQATMSAPAGADLTPDHAEVKA